ncbi:hypothetical protein [Pseudomonas veronii]|uniref:hypothetical protein n=1 Tax=Pseudomonas veronii TaxID=76761 RepID=UPI002D76A072|nr:hypothetical protein [Pseudomonas veronii]WRU62658.1 hypothetical protein VPH48_31510 [Pseudomonas veronii]WRU66375.1 hypothetical protein VPH48_33975 [Pseudomonas veronii]
MSLKLTEGEMRQALFGGAGTKSPSDLPQICATPEPRSEEELQRAEPKAGLSRKPKSKPLSPKLRVTLHVAKVFDGETEVFVHEANTLSTLLAEQEARRAAVKKRFKYFDLVSIEPV